MTRLTLNEDGIPLTRVGQIAYIVIGIGILVAAAWWFSYKVVVCEHSLRIEPFAQEIRFDEIRNIKIDAVKGGSFCLIETKSGKKFSVGAGLIDFYLFLRLLSQEMKSRQQGSAESR